MNLSSGELFFEYITPSHTERTFKNTILISYYLAITSNISQGFFKTVIITMVLTYWIKPLWKI